MHFLSKDEGFRFSFDSGKLDQLKKFIKKKRKETGGIIIGNYTKDLHEAIVEGFTSAPKDSRSGLFWFLRGNWGLKKILEAYWAKNMYYLGEWHYHPYASPNPSGQDILQMKKIARSKDYNCPQPILLIIGGSSEEFQIRTFVVPDNSNNIIEMLEAGNEADINKKISNS